MMKLVQDKLHDVVEKVVPGWPQGPEHDCIACCTNLEDLDAISEALLSVVLDEPGE